MLALNAWYALPQVVSGSALSGIGLLGLFLELVAANCTI